MSRIYEAGGAKIFCVKWIANFLFIVVQYHLLYVHIYVENIICYDTSK